MIDGQREEAKNGHPRRDGQDGQGCIGDSKNGKGTDTAIRIREENKKWTIASGGASRAWACCHFGIVRICEWIHGLARKNKDDSRDLVSPRVHSVHGLDNSSVLHIRDRGSNLEESALPVESERNRSNNTWQVKGDEQRRHSESSIGSGHKANSRPICTRGKLRVSPKENKITMWAYVMTFDDSVSVENLVKELDSVSEILNWYSCLPRSVFIVSEYDAKTLSKIIRSQTSVNNFIILDAKTDKNGWLPKKAWNFLNNPKKVG